ncbi:MAG: CAP domain-containing protein [Patescibacteria group bacterium]
MSYFHRKIRDSFIPQEQNEFRPHVLRHKFLAFIASLVIVVKVGVLLLVALTPGYVLPVDITNQNIVNLTNQQRLNAGLSELKLNSRLSQAASAKAADMLSNQYFSHYSPSNVSPWYWFQSAGYEYAYAGENLAMDFVTAESTVSAWMASESHKKNILNSKFSEIGVGVIEGDFKGAKTILVVQEFAAPAPTKTVASNTTVTEVTKPATTETKPVQQTVTPTVEAEKNLPKVEAEKTVVLPSPAKEDTYDVTVKVEEPPAETPPAEPPAEITQVAVNLGGNTADLNKTGDQYVGSVEENQNGQKNDLDILVQSTQPTTDESNVITAPVMNTDFFKTTILRPDKFFTSEKLVQIILYSRNFFLALLLFLSLALILNVLIKVRVQHRPTIVYSLLVIYMISVIIII